MNFILSNSLGQTVGSFKLKVGITKIEDSDNLANGVYFLMRESETTQIKQNL